MKYNNNFLLLIESLDKFALGIFKQFKIEEDSEKVVLIAPSEEYRKWAIEYTKTKLIGFGKRLEVRLNQEIQSKAKKIGVLEKFTFDNYIVGMANTIVYKVCMEVSEKPGISFNPLFIYGPVGHGKTHLLHAIGNRAYSLGYSVIYTSINDFSDEMVKAIKKGNAEEFRKKYSEVDVLLIDDVQFLSGKERTQVELFRIFEYMQAKEKQMVLVSDRHPKQLKDVPDRLVSRFEGGLIVEVGLDEETKLSIIKQKLILYGLPVDKRTIDYVHENTGYNVREIEGFIRGVKVKGIEDIPKVSNRQINTSIESVIKFVAKHFKLKQEEILKDTKERKITNAKHIAMYMCKTVLGSSYSEIARYFNKKDHTSVLYSVRKVEEKLREDRKYALMIRFLEKSLKEYLKEFSN